MLWNDSHTLLRGVILWYNEITLYHVEKLLLHTKWYGIINSEGMLSLSYFLKRGNPLKMWNISRWFITCNTISVFWLQKESYNRIWWKNSWGAYLTLKNDPYTPCNTISSMVIVCIRYVIFWTKRGILSQCEISPVRFITCNAISLCCLQKGG